MIVANDVRCRAGFNSDTNIVKFLFPDNEVRETGTNDQAEVTEELFEYCSAFCAKSLNN